MEPLNPHPPMKGCLLVSFLSPLWVTAVINYHADGSCRYNRSTQSLDCKDISFGQNKSVIVKRHRRTEHKTLFEVEVAAYARIAAVSRPKGCEGFVLFPRMLSSDRTSKTITIQRFGQPIGCLYGNMSCCKSMCSKLPIHGPTGLCQQLACIGTVMRLANVTHLDMHPKVRES